MTQRVIGIFDGRRHPYAVILPYSAFAGILAGKPTIIIPWWSIGVIRFSKVASIPPRMVAVVQNTAPILSTSFPFAHIYPSLSIHSFKPELMVPSVRTSPDYRIHLFEVFDVRLLT